MLRVLTMAEADTENTSQPTSESSYSSEDLRETPSLLNRFRSAQPSNISRPRKVKKNEAATRGGNKRSYVSGRSRHNPKSTSPYQRGEEFPGENLTILAGTLFCSGCNHSRE